VLLALTTGNKILLALFAGVFIAFALVASFVLPRRNPDFPGEAGRNWFIVATLALFVAMMFAVAVFAREEEEEARGGEEAGEVVTETAPGDEPQPQETTEGPGGGDPAAGRTVFTSQGCGNCHTFEAAGTNSSVGPNLDESLQGDDAEHIRQSIVDPNAEVESGFQPIMPGNFGEELSPKQLEDLVAFLQS
jgi:mono/diheme cytochrome c family protein